MRERFQGFALVMEVSMGGQRGMESVRQNMQNRQIRRVGGLTEQARPREDMIRGVTNLNGLWKTPAKP